MKSPVTRVLMMMMISPSLVSNYYGVIWIALTNHTIDCEYDDNVDFVYSGTMRISNGNSLCTC